VRFNAHNWQPRRLDELGFVGRGKSRHRPRNDSRLYGGPYPFIQTAEIMAADPYITTYSQTYTEYGLQQSRKWPANTLCITIAGANTAETAILKFEACFPDSVIGFVPDESKADLHFVKYALDAMKSKFRSVTRGATQDNLSLDKLFSFPIPTPPLPVQRQIAGLLTPYDELIGNSRRRMEVLENMTRAVYREWFEEFRFPGHERAKFVPSPIGNIPLGWEVRHVSEFADFVRGYEPGSEAYRKESAEGYVRFLRVGDLGKRSSETYVDKNGAGECVLKRDDIAITLDGSVGLVRLGMEGAYSTGIRKVVVRDENRLGWSFAYHLLLSAPIQTTIAAHAKGATIKHAGSAVAALRFASAPTAILGRFEEVTVPMLRAVLCLQSTIDRLRRARDLLLPRLLSNGLEAASTT
jgi:type I restriction enzyme S subunit